MNCLIVSSASFVLGRYILRHFRRQKLSDCWTRLALLEVHCGVQIILRLLLLDLIHS